jgi:hypothetical protein
VKLASLDDLVPYLKRRPLPALCWYGPRASDAVCLRSLLQLTGIICCYAADLPFTSPVLSPETAGLRRKCSIDDLAGVLIANGQLETFCRATLAGAVLPYDSTPELEAFCSANGLFCLSAKDDLKISLGDKTRIDEVSSAVGLHPIPGLTGSIDDMDFESLVREVGLPVFLHFARGAGGSGNYIVETKDAFDTVKCQRRGQRLNAKRFVTGVSCSMDICVTRQSILCGPLEEMIIGAPPLNSNPTEYVASSWFRGFVSQEVEEEAHQAGLRIGAWARAQGFFGFFHPDFLVRGDQIFLTELNMRFGGSCGVFAAAELEAGRLPLMIAHILAFLDDEVVFDADAIHARASEPLDQAVMVLKNTKPARVRIEEGRFSGIYRCTDRGIEWTGRSGTARDLVSDELLLTGLPPNGQATIVEPGAFIAQAVTRFPISNRASGLNRRGRKLADDLLLALTSPVS